MRSYKYNHMHAGRIACSTAAQVLAHYLMIDQLSAIADCCQTDGSRGLRAIADDHTFI